MPSRRSVNRSDPVSSSPPLKPHHAAPATPGRAESTPATPKFSIKATVEEARLYDFVAARPPMKNTTIIESIGHLIKGCLGAGIVSVHENYQLCGIWTALVLNLVLGFAVAYVIWLLCTTAQKVYGRVQVPIMSYPDVAEAALIICPYVPLRKYSTFARYWVDVTVIVDLFASCTVYMVVMARTIKQLYEMTDKTNDDGIRYFVLALLIPCIVISWILELKYLAPFTIIGDIFIVTVAMATVYYGTQAAKHSVFDTNQFPIIGKWNDVFMVMGALIYSMEGVGVSLAIENHLTEPKKISVVIIGAYSIVVPIVMIVGYFGFWGFGSGSKSPVTLNFPWSWVSVVLKVFMALMTYTTFALNFWVPFDLCWYYLKKRHDPSKHWMWARIYRSLIVCCLCCVALIFPDVAAFNGLIGSFCLSNMGFIYPALIDYSVNWDDPLAGSRCYKTTKCIGIVIFGLLVCVIGSISAIKTLVGNVYG